jgi:hypothetical protein
MKDLIEALTILMKYGGADTYSPTHCEHDVLMVLGGGEVSETSVSDVDKARLGELGFFWNEQYECWASYRFGSA